MERKTKHRILGIIVIAALVVAVLPLFHGGNNDVKLDPQLVNAPPFPDQTAQLNDNANPEFKVALANQASPIPFKNNQEYDNGINQLPDDTINPQTSQAFGHANKQPPAASTMPQPIKAPAISDDEDDNNSEAVIGSIEKKPEEIAKAETPSRALQDTQGIFRNSLESELQAAAKTVAKKTAHQPAKGRDTAAKMKQAQLKPKKHSPLDDNGLFKLKNSAWVIQLGSYKSKSSALKLVNRLRANGYSAFIQEASVGTSVYVGPEEKEVVARSLAARIEYEMQIQGLVISYKPLTL